MSTRNEIDAIEQELREWRHHLHANPETAFEEVNTSNYIAEKLKSFGLEPKRGLAKTGLVATLNKGASSPDRSIALRADMDALDMEEQNQLPYRSKIPGKMHACGHDGHVAMLLGAAKILTASKTFNGTVHFIFQPAEENFGGGGIMVEEGLFERFPAKAVFGMHNFPTIPKGKFAITSGPMMAAYDVFDIDIKGFGGHAAMPQFVKDPIVTAASLINQLQTIVSRSLNPLESAVVSVTDIHGGTAYNIIPDKVHIRGTTRHFQPEVQQTIESKMAAIINGIATASGTTIDFTYARRYPALVNTKDETMTAVKVAASLVGKDNVNSNMQPIMGSEDFAFLLQKRPGAYIRIGSGIPGSSANLHQTTYDFNDDILTLGVNYWVSLVEHLLPV